MGDNEKKRFISSKYIANKIIYDLIMVERTAATLFLP